MHVLRHDEINATLKVKRLPIDSGLKIKNDSMVAEFQKRHHEKQLEITR
jgi:hypothetical protein